VSVRGFATRGELTTHDIRALRGAKSPPDPWTPLGHLWEIERGLRVSQRRVLTVFLAGAECPFTCLFCDLWRSTLEGPTPAGALPAQLEQALEDAAPIDPPAALKLYNASNFFDPRAVPPRDHRALAALCAGFERVTVECHPRLLRKGCESFATRLAGRLEIAMGLETVHPDVFPRLNKGMDFEDFDRAVGWARDHEIGTRAFILVGLPWVPAAEFARWSARSVEHAAAIGIDRASLIPLRTGNGALDRLMAAGDLEPVTLEHMEAALQTGLAAAGRMTVELDLWDAEEFATCPRCVGARVARLGEMNREQALRPGISCECRATSHTVEPHAG